jgi:2,4-dienoyl-CoA reductase-like NADH-dependent reductase (Old Yellow Enzyme family)
MSKLFTPIKVGSVEFRNRVWIAPMCMYSCDDQDGLVNDFHVAHHTKLALGGAGLIIAEATGVTPEGRITPWCAGLWNDDQTAAWKRVVDQVHFLGGKIGIQLAHAGRKGSTNRGWPGYENGSVPIADGGWQTVSSTSEAFPGYAEPRMLTTAETSEFPKAFAAAARRAVAAGFDAVEVHAAHGYLVHQYLSPLTNQRDDQYGGSLENRARLLLEIVAAVRHEVGAGYPVLVRISATDWHPEGFTEEEAAQVLKWAKEAGADLFDITTAGLVPGVQIPVGPGYQIPAAQYIAEHNGDPVSGVGLITTGVQAEKILEETELSVILIGRAALRDPFWPARAAAELGETLPYWPPQYHRSWFEPNA